MLYIYKVAENSILESLLEVATTAERVTAAEILAFKLRTRLFEYSCCKRNFKYRIDDVIRVMINRD